MTRFLLAKIQSKNLYFENPQSATDQPTNYLTLSDGL